MASLLVHALKAHLDQLHKLEHRIAVLNYLILPRQPHEYITTLNHSLLLVRTHSCPSMERTFCTQ